MVKLLTDEEVKRYFCSSVILTGIRQKNGSVKCTADLDYFLNDWPDEIECGPNNYTLENIHKFDNGLEQADYR